MLESKVDKVYCNGTDILHMYRELPKRLQGGHTEDLEQLITTLETAIRNNDVILFKGSAWLKQEMKTVIKALKGE